MPATKTARVASKPSKSREAPLEASGDNDSASTADWGSDDPMDKDETEVELEKLIFGDQAGFDEALRSHESGKRALVAPTALETNKGGQGDLDQGLEGLDDADLFVLDSRPSAVDIPDLQVERESDEESNPGDAPAWIDSDDERLIVSLASKPQLRKLRISESEDLVNGKEYTKRLRRQFERLYPAPEWANPSSTSKVQHPHKRRRTNSYSSDSSADAHSENDFNSQNPLSTQPLAALLQNKDILTQPPTSRATPRPLRPSILPIHRLKDVTPPHPSPISTLTFHPTSPLLLSSSPSLLSLHHISPSSPTPNPLLTTLHLRSTPLTTTAFLPPTGSKIFLAARRRYFHIWSLPTGSIEKVSRVLTPTPDAQRTMERFKPSPCGRYIGLVASTRKGGGEINILDAHTCQWVAAVRVEGNNGVADFAWWADGGGVCVVGKGGEAVEWDGAERRVVRRWVDEGAVGTTVIECGGRSKGLGGWRWIAVGSSAGIVNLYDRLLWRGATTGEGSGVPERLKPTKAFAHLTTPVSSLTFSPDAQILCLASRWKRDALRLVHLGSLTVYRNFPKETTPLGRVTAVAWKAGNRGDGGELLLAVGNEAGRVRLWGFGE